MGHRTATGIVALLPIVAVVLPAPAPAQLITFETLPAGGATVDGQTITSQYAAPADGDVTFSLVKGFCQQCAASAPVIAKVGNPRTAFQGPDNTSFPLCGVPLGSPTRDDMPNAADQAITSCSFLTDDPSTLLNPCKLRIDYGNPVSTASGRVLDIDGMEQWTVTAFSGTTSVQTLLLVPPGVGPAFDGLASPFTLDPPGSQTFDGIEIDYAGPTCNTSVGLAFDYFQTSGSACIDVPPSTVAWYPFDYLDPAVYSYSVTPELISGLHAVKAGAVSFTNGGYVAGALDLDGVDDYVHVPPSPVFDADTDGVGFDAWIFVDPAGTGGPILSRQLSGANEIGYELRVSGVPGPRALSFLINDGVAQQSYFLDSGLTVPEGAWVHVAATLAPVSADPGLGFDAEFWVDGTSSGLVAGGANDVSLYPAKGELWIGRGIGYFDGMIDELEVYGTALTTPTVQAVNDASTSGKCRCAAIDSRVSAWWPAEGTLADALRGQNDGIALLGGAGYTNLAQGRVGQAFALDGVDDAVELPATIDPSFDSFALDAWIQFTGPMPDAIEPILDKRSGTGRGYFLYLASGQLQLDLQYDDSGPPLVAAGGPDLADGDWHHVAAEVVRTASTSRLFVDGKPVSSFDASVPVGTLTNSASLLVGSSHAAADFFEGHVDEIEYWGAPESLPESPFELTIAAIYQAADYGKCPPIRGVDPTDGISDGGDVLVHLPGVIVSCPSPPGLAQDAIVELIAQCINNSPEAQDLGISALALESRVVFLGGSAIKVTTTDPGLYLVGLTSVATPVPGLAARLLGLLALLVALTGLRAARSLSIRANSNRLARLIPLALSFGVFGVATDARAGFGEVQIDSTTDTTMTVSWTGPSFPRKYCGASQNVHKICIKETGFLSADACDFTVLFADKDDMARQITGLTADTKYKLRVFSRTTASGGGGRCRYREVAERRQRTTTAVPSPRSGSIYRSAGDPDTDYAEITAIWSHPMDFAKVRACYAKTGRPEVGLKKCGRAADPWKINKAKRGFGETPTEVGGAYLVDLSPLDDCRKYRFVGYGFPSGMDGTLIGEVEAATGADSGTACKRIIDFEEFAADDLATNDSDGIGFEYLTAVGGSLAAPIDLATDNDFEPVTSLHAFFRVPGDPYIPGEWNAEAADVLTGSDVATGIEPRNGAGMLRMNAGGGTSSQVNQIIGPVGPVSPAGDTIARWAIYVNAPSATALSLFMNAGSGQTSVGTLTDLTSVTIPFTTDSDPDTWERVEGTRTLPASTAFLELQIASAVAQIPADGLFFDFANVILDPSGLIWDLSLLDSQILTDAEILAGDGVPLADDAKLLAYLLDGDTDLFHAWQDQLAATDPSLALTQWLVANYPGVYSAIAFDFSVDVPALGQAGAIALVLALTAVGVRRSGRRRRRSANDE